jgi:DNA-binding MarR family transcriptional regulator
MSEDETQVEETTEATEETTTEKSKKTKPKPKKAAKKVAKKPAAKKATKKPVKKSKGESRPARDDARKVASASKGKLTTDQVRILRSLSKGRPTTMEGIKEGCGMTPEQKYSGGFLKGVHNLIEARMVKIEKDQDNRAHSYTITDKGKNTLKSAEDAVE